MINFWRILCVLVGAAAFCVAGCGSGGTASAKKKVMIGFIGKSVDNPVFQAAQVGAQDEAKELSAKMGMDIEVNLQTPSGHEDPVAQAQVIDALVRSGAKGIAISCSDAKTVTPAINRAVDAGVTVMCFDSDAADSKRMCYFGTDDIACGTQVMRLLAKEMGEKGTVAILAGNPTAPNLQKRVEGVREELKKYPNMHELSIGAVYHEEDAAKAAEKIREVQLAHPDIGGWAMIGGWPLFTKNALPWAPGTVKVVSVDALPKELSYLDSGHVQVLIAQDCYGWGHKSVEILTDKIVNGKEPAEKRIIDPLTLVTKENAAEWSKKWDKWLKSAP
jgi:ribose transport system substrate-binding protein